VAQEAFLVRGIDREISRRTTTVPLVLLVGVRHSRTESIGPSLARLGSFEPLGQVVDLSARTLLGQLFSIVVDDVDEIQFDEEHHDDRLANVNF
jgi:hypothetical protein